jgi:hypothetical protein
MPPPRKADKKANAMASTRPSVAEVKADLLSLAHDLKQGSISNTQLLFRGRLSLPHLAQLKPRLGEIPKTQMATVPELYRAYRELKFLAEGVTLTPAEVRHEYADLISDIRAAIDSSPFDIRTKTDLCDREHWLYKKVSSDPHSSNIFRYAGLTEGRPDYWYWDDQELAERAANFDSFTQVHYRDNDLRRHLKGRGLYKLTTTLNPSFARHFFVGLNHEPYRSEPELITGNYLILNTVPHEHEVNTNIIRKGSTRPQIADFFLTDYATYLELLQNETPNRGSRRLAYAARNKEKAASYANKIACIFIDTDPFYHRGVFQVSEFSKHLHKTLLDNGIDIGTPPPAEKLAWRDDELKMKLLTLPTPKEVIDLLNTLGCKTIKILQDRFSSLLTLIKLRKDYKAIRRKMKRQSYALRSAKASERYSKKREKYVSLSLIKKLFVIERITSQVKWYAYAKKNRAILRLCGIPTSLPGVYKARGEWLGWGFLTGNVPYNGR